MQLIINEGQMLNEPQVIINCIKKDSRIQKLENYVNQISVNITAECDGRCCIVCADKILYIEAVDRKTFLYTEENIYQSKEPLYSLEELLNRTGIVRISKSCLLNVDSLRSIRPFSNHRFEAELVNGEKLLISRTYINEIKNKLQL